MKKIKIKMFDNLKYRMVMSLFVVNLLVTVIMNAFTFSLVDKVLSKQIFQTVLSRVN